MKRPEQIRCDGCRAKIEGEPFLAIEGFEADSDVQGRVLVVRGSCIWDFEERVDFCSLGCMIQRLDLAGPLVAAAVQADPPKMVVACQCRHGQLRCSLCRWFDGYPMEREIKAPDDEEKP